MTAIFVYTTFPNNDTAQEIAENVVEKGLAACANIFQPHQSIYKWEGSVQRESEITLIFKTTDERYDALEAFIVSKHPYDTPCVVALPIEKGFAPFLEWIEGNALG